MDNIKNIVTGGVITLVIGGTAFTFSQQAVVDNFAEDTGVTQEEAAQYVDKALEEELFPFAEVGADFINYSKETFVLANDIDCENYEYEWESTTLTCIDGKTQLEKIANSEQMLGQAYIKLSSDNASESDTLEAIKYIDQLNSDYDLEIYSVYYTDEGINEMKMTNSFNKSLLKASLESGT